MNFKLQLKKVSQHLLFKIKLFLLTQVVFVVLILHFLKFPPVASSGHYRKIRAPACPKI